MEVKGKKEGIRVYFLLLYDDCRCALSAELPAVLKHANRMNGKGRD